jgi:tetratricopeptide (TPR) repeat protein
MADGQEDDIEGLKKRIKALEEEENNDVYERIKKCKAISESNSKWYRHQGIVTMSILTLFIAAFSGFSYFVVYLGGKNFIKRAVVTSIEKNAQPMFSKYKEDLDERSFKMENRIEFNYWYKQGEKAFEEGDLASAVIYFTDAINKDPKHVYAVGVRGIAYARLGKLKKAIVDLDKAIDIKEDYAVAYGYKGHAHFYLREYVTAFNAFHKEVDLFIKRGNFENASVELSAMSSYFEKAKVDEKFDKEMQKSIADDIEQLKKQLEEAEKKRKEKERRL